MVADDSTDLDAIHVALDWHITSIQSYRMTYTVSTEYDPKGWALLEKAMAEEDRHSSGSNYSVREVPPPLLRRYEVVCSGDRNWIRSSDRGEGSSYSVRVFDGKNTFFVTHASNGEATVASISQGRDRIAPSADSPLLYAGLVAYQGHDDPPVGINEYVARDHCVVKGIVTHSKRSLVHVESDATPLGEGRMAIRRFLLDPAYDYLPYKMEFVDVASGKPILEHTVSEFRKVTDEATGKSRWFPIQGAFKDYLSRGQLYATTTTKVESVAINPQVPTEQFTVQLRDGIPVIDNLTHQAKLLGPSKSRDDLAKRLSDDSKKALDEAVDAARSRPKVSAHAFWGLPGSAIVLGGASLLCVTVGVWLMRRS